MYDVGEQGYELDYTKWDSLDELERYVIETKVSHTAKGEAEMNRFVACYIFLGYAINFKYKTKWILVNDGSVHNGMFAIADLPKEPMGLYFVPRAKIKSVILGRVRELKENVRRSIEDEFISTVVNTPTEDV